MKTYSSCVYYDAVRSYLRDAGIPFDEGAFLEMDAAIEVARRLHHHLTVLGPGHCSSHPGDGVTFTVEGEFENLRPFGAE